MTNKTRTVVGQFLPVIVLVMLVLGWALVDLIQPTRVLSDGVGMLWLALMLFLSGAVTMDGVRSRAIGLIATGVFGAALSCFLIAAWTACS